MSDGAMSQDEIDALLAGVDATNLTLKGPTPDDDLIGEDETDVERMFATIGKSTSTRKSQIQVFYGVVEAILSDIVKLRNDGHLLDKQLSTANSARVLSIISLFQKRLHDMTAYCDQVIASGYEILLLNKEKDESE
jgi:hypothetical protein